MNMQESFEEAGFLSRRAKRGIHSIRAENRGWFQLAYDLNTVLMRAAMAGMNGAHGNCWSQEAVAVRLLLRTTSSLQGVLLLSERGMIAPARTLVRTIVEDSFCAAALADKPDEVVRMLRDDAEASRRGQASFIFEYKLGNDPEILEKVEKLIKETERKPRINWRDMAKRSSILPLYLSYQILSDDSLHTSASSLAKHVVRHAGGNGWTHHMGPGQPGDIASTLHNAVMAVMPVGIAVTQIAKDDVNNSAIVALADRFQRLPIGNIA